MGASSTGDTTEGTPGRGQLTGRVFISSTSVDLPRYRENVRDTLLRLDLMPVGMEQFGARPSGDATSVSLDKLAGCDCYVGVFGWRYGYIPAGETRSVTHLEYLEARRLGMDCYVFLAAPTTQDGDAPGAPFPSADRDPEHAAELRAFRAALGQGHVVDFFTTPDDLGRKVATALSGYVVRVKERRAGGGRPPRDLPSRAPEFVGRGRELAELEAALRRGQSMGLAAAVAGMGGVGKSALAAEALNRLANAQPPAFPGGVTWVRCDGRTGPAGLAWALDQLLTAWGAVLPPEAAARAGDDAEEGVRLRARALGARLRPAEPGAAPAPALVLLDNVEVHFPLERALEIAAPLGITVLATARHQPRVAGLRLVELDVLAPDAALGLFAERYADRGGAWEPARDEAPARAAVELLGRLPLAIELAAARAAFARTGVAALAEHLRAADRLGQLRLPGEDTRTTSVRYALAQSLGDLSEVQLARFAALGLPDGPDWPRPTIEALLAAVPPEAAGAGPADEDLDLLASLSLAELLPPETPGVPAPRVRLHPLLRALAHEGWAQQPEATRTAGLAALLDAVGEIARQRGADFATLAREEELIAGALRQAAREHVEPRRLIVTIAALWEYLLTGGHWHLGVDLYQLKLQAYRELGDRNGEGLTLGDLGTMAQPLGRVEEAARNYEAALAILRETLDRRGERQVLNNLGTLARDRGRAEEAARYLEQALAITREVGDRAGEGQALGNLGVVAQSRGRVEEAARYYEQALVVARETGDRRHEGQVLGNLGNLASARGHMEEAKRYLEQALAIAREVGARASEGITLIVLGSMAQVQGRAQEATAYFEQAMAIARETGNRSGEGAALANLGTLARTNKHVEEAARYLERALAIFQEVGERASEGQALTSLGNVAYDRGHAEEAARYYEQALVVAHEVGDRSGEGLVLGNLGYLAHIGGRPEEAARYLERALAIFQEVGNRRGEGHVLENLGEMARVGDRPEEARQYFERALAIYDAIGEVDAAHGVREALEALRTSPPPPAELNDAEPEPRGSAPAQDLVPPEAAAPAKHRRRWPFGR